MRGYPDACKDGATKNPEKPNIIKHIAFVEGLDEERFNSNHETFEPFHMNAGESRDLWVELDFKRRP